MKKAQTESQTARRPRRKRSLLRILLLLIVLGVVAIGALVWWGWVPEQMYNRSPGDYLRHYEGDYGTSFTLGVIEFDDHGELWDRSQFTDVLDELCRQSAAATDGLVLHMFIHGWTHNASWNRPKGRLTWYKHLLEDLSTRSAMAVRTSDHKYRPIFGVYIGWRGDIITTPYLRDLTFFNRRIAARRAASTEMLEVLTALADAGRANRESRVVLVGHSMGAAILYETLVPALTGQLLNYGMAGVPLSVDWDMCIFINQALSAGRVKQVTDFLQRNRVRLALCDDKGTTSPCNGPLMVALSSENDMVTQRIFPFGMWFVSRFLGYHDYPDPDAPTQYDLDIHTAANVPSLLSHSVTVSGTEVSLAPRPGSRNHTPFWIMQVPESICENHNDLDKPLLLKLVIDLMQRNHVFDPAVRPVVLLEPEWRSAMTTGTESTHSSD